ncbi:MMPL domain protein [Xylanimonas cellulosilytica DSM 15894]|uniref:MMPL domain protein n=1 Tax=Xylanimonas cellulosilytica (strain DSM 15894 / JCM 12276 / CECT 5975 / KCTC 9989 / LMG 20990 / NBRC 107835 / XIL07) TaxID=446471 RepID=D1C0L5_XYLCX|nr:MMPL family transporter [Xylanimonas cellulosilytica]ACZ32218.1 MMPL domain protein [Xylanimonas cellulosilytica DSM 15894]
MSSVLYQLGRWALHARRLVVVGWVVILAVVGGTAGLVMQGLDNEVTIPGTEANAALERLAATFPQVSGMSAQVVIVTPGETIAADDVRAPLEDAVAALADVDQVVAVTSPFDDLMPASVNDAGTATILQIQLDGDLGSITDGTKDELTAAVGQLQEALPDGARAELGGQLFATEFPAISLMEGVGLLVALVVLVLTLGSFVAAGLPLINALVGVGVSMGLLFAATTVATIGSTTPMLAVMLGLAVGIDYALFIVSRHRDQLRDGMGVEESIARATATAGSAVVFAGLTVMIALVGLGVAGIPFLTVMGVTAAMGVGIAVLVSLTLLPALLGFAGERLRPRAAAVVEPVETTQPVVEPVETTQDDQRGVVSTGSTTGEGGGFFGGWVRGVTRWPAVTVLVVVVALGALSWPATGLRLALPDAGVLPADSDARIAYDLISEEFGEGFNGPLIVTAPIVTSTDPLGLMDALADEIRALPGVADVPLATPNETADTGIIQVVPEGGPTSEATEDLVHEIRALRPHLQETYGVEIAVTGFTAVGIDVSAKLGEALLPFGVVVVGLCLVLLTMVFRSIWVPIKAALGYLLSVGAAFGVVTLVFQDGFLADALNVTRTGPVISFMPIVLMGVLFGLAMDYEVFLVSRMREDYVHGVSTDTGRARRAVLSGFRASAPVVTAAAVIMFAVFVAFVPHGDMNLKPIALGLAVGVAIDAFVVRMVLVPAVMALLGEHAWWMPRWLDRVLPRFDVEGEGITKELALADWPEPGATDAVVARDLVVDGPRGPVVGPVTVRVPDGGALVVRADDVATADALLLALAGRLHLDAGAVKVAGYVLPERAGAVRRRVAVVDAAPAGRTPAPRGARPEPAAASAVRHTVRGAGKVRSRAVVVLHAEAIVERDARDALAAALADAQAAGVTVLLGTTGADGAHLMPQAPLLDLTTTRPAFVGAHARLDGAAASGLPLGSVAASDGTERSRVHSAITPDTTPGTHTSAVAAPTLVDDTEVSL